MTKVKEFLSKIQSDNINRKIHNLIIIGLIGVALILAGSFFFDNSDEEEPQLQESFSEISKDMDYEKKIKLELEEILGAIEGVGKVDVMITIANESEAEIAYSTTESQNVTQEKDNQGGQRITDQKNLTETAVMVNENGGNTPFVTRENRPEIKGVMVVAQGAHNPDIKYRLDQAVQTALDLPSYKVVIYARKN
jgi:stage III sporulation protein AG